jgi:hypothetical protein
MLTAEKCRIYATESELLGTNFQSIMALKWRSQASGLDEHNAQLSMARVSKRTALGTLRIAGPGS